MRCWGAAVTAAEVADEVAAGEGEAAVAVAVGVAWGVAVDAPAAESHRPLAAAEDGRRRDPVCRRAVMPDAFRKRDPAVPWRIVQEVVAVAATLIGRKLVRAAVVVRAVVVAGYPIVLTSVAVAAGPGAVGCPTGRILVAAVGAPVAAAIVQEGVVVGVLIGPISAAAVIVRAAVVVADPIVREGAATGLVVVAVEGPIVLAAVVIDLISAVAGGRPCVPIVRGKGAAASNGVPAIDRGTDRGTDPTGRTDRAIDRFTSATTISTTGTIGMAAVGTATSTIGTVGTTTGTAVGITAIAQAGGRFRRPG